MIIPGKGALLSSGGGEHPVNKLRSQYYEESRVDYRFRRTGLTGGGGVMPALISNPPDDIPP